MFAFNHEMVKRRRSRTKFKVDFPENEASNEKNVFHVFDLFFHVQSPSPQLYHQYGDIVYKISATVNTLYICSHTAVFSNKEIMKLSL